MTTLDKTADQIVADIVKSGVWLTIPQRKVVWALIVGKVRPMVIEQATLPFSHDQEKSKEQAMKILALLKERRSFGATNVELVKIAMNHTARISELRQKPHYYRIICKQEKGRIFRYFLSPECW